MYMYVVVFVMQVPMGGTDCAQPMIYAQKKRLSVDVFIVYTDCETWAGRNHLSLSQTHTHYLSIYVSILHTLSPTRTCTPGQGAQELSPVNWNRREAHSVCHDLQWIHSG